MADRLKTILQRWSRQRMPQLNGRLYLKTLQDKVVIRRDRWGIPHIKAKTRHDLFLAQGFVHAQDRLWQMELNRRAATGTLSEIFGPITLDTDRLSRTFGFARLAKATLSQLEDQARVDLTAYTAGVNNFLEKQTVLPLEFAILQHNPQPWELVDSLAYAHLQMWALTHGAFGELVKAQLLKQVDPELVHYLLMDYPNHFPATLPDGIEENALWLDAWQGTAVPWQNPFLGKGNLDGAGRGSNGWVVAPERSQSGGALLANDMHLPVGTPSIWHFQHLQCEALHAAGFTQPGLPYVMVGHNGRIAWGATLAYTDCEDLFIEKIHPDDDTLYQFGQSWQPLEQIPEEIQVRFQKPHTEKISLTHHGPLIHKLLAEPAQPLAFNSTALRPGATIDGFGWLNTAENWDEFVTAVARIQAPSLNLLYADYRGNIGHWVTGRVPIRAAGDGTVPVPGWDGQHEWIGVIPMNEMPHALNPQNGLIISANHQIAPPEKSKYNLGHLWRNGYRAERIRQLLDSYPQISPEICRKVQLDQLSLPGLQLMELVKDLLPAEEKSRISLELLQQWDGQLTPESVGGTVFQVFMEQLSTALLEQKIPVSLQVKLLGTGISENLHPVNEFQGYLVPNLLRILQHLPPAWIESRFARDEMILRCLAQTTTYLQNRMGDDPTSWQWGQLHQVTFKHALGRLKPFEHVLNVGPLSLGGDGNTVAQSGMRPGNFASDGISVSSRFIIDMSAVGQAAAILTPGQSGHLGSDHYGDLAPMWQQGDYFPLLWQENAVKEGAVHTLTMTKGP